MTIKKILTFSLASAFALLLTTSIALAGHNGAAVEVNTLTCGETTFNASIVDPNATHKVANMRLVVDVDGVVQYTNVIPTNGDSVSLTVGPFENNTVINWRVFGGGERSYDQPLWNGYGQANFVSNINAYVAEVEGFGWVLSGVADENPFTNWNEVPVEGCPPAPITKDMCKKDGWAELGFSNQGRCIQFVNTGKDSR